VCAHLAIRDDGLALIDIRDLLVYRISEGTCQNVGLLFGLSFGFPYFLLCSSFDLLNLAFELFRFVIRQFAYFFTNLSLDVFTFSLYFFIAHVNPLFILDEVH
jgi:hypothetical protein